MPRYIILTLIPILLLIAPASRAIEVYDASTAGDAVMEGTNILSIDYIWMAENGVTETGADYPYASLWLVLYDPRPYEDEDEMDEDQWKRSHEITRLQIPGPSHEGHWGVGDEVAFRDFGVYDWASDSFDRVVFRLYVEEPEEGVATDTLMWGTIQEDDTYDASLAFQNDLMYAHFRTITIPEARLRAEVSITDIWMEHNVELDGYTGIQIHVEFEIDNMRARLSRMAVYVHLDSNGESVTCQIDDPAYNTPAGYLTTQQEFVPVFPETIFEDFTLFIPYEAFPTSDDFVDYHANLEILDEDWNYLGSEQTPTFSVMRPKNP